MLIYIKWIFNPVHEGLVKRGMVLFTKDEGNVNPIFFEY